MTYFPIKNVNESDEEVFSEYIKEEEFVVVLLEEPLVKFCTLFRRLTNSFHICKIFTQYRCKVGASC